MASYLTQAWCQTLSQDIASNTSRVRIHFQFVRTDYSCYGYNGNGTFWSISCDGQSASGNWLTEWNIGQNCWCEVAIADFTVGHASNGTKSIGYAGSLNFNGAAPGSLSASGATTLSTIPRYFTSGIGFSCNSTTQTTSNFSWNTSETCDWGRVYLNGSGYWTDVPGAVNATSGSFNYFGHYNNNSSANASSPAKSTLLPGTEYRIKINCRRKDSGLFSDSNTITFSTKPIATVTNKNINFNIGSSLTLNFANNTANSSYLKLYAKNTSENWVLITSTTETIGAASYTLGLTSETIKNALYSLCTNKNTLEVKLVCGTTINGIDYNNENCGTKTVISGIATVVNSNPIFTNFTISNNDTVSNSLVGSTYMLSGYGNMVATISAGNKMVAVNQSTASIYRISYGFGNTYKMIGILYKTGNIVLELGKFETESVSYFVKIEAIDSRGNSTTVTKNFVVLPYHAPILNATVNRHHNFEKETFLELNSSISRLTLGTVDKNDKVSLSYKTRNNGDTAWGASTEITTSITKTTSGNNYLYAVIKNTLSNKFIDLDIEKSYDILFTLKDKYTQTELLISVPQGIAIMEIRNDGVVLVGVAPSAFTDGNKLRVGSDIVIRDRNSNSGSILDNIFKISNTEPQSQLNNCIWFDIK